MKEWGHTSNVNRTQEVFWDNLRQLWNRFCQEIQEPSLDIGAGRKKGRTVSLDPFPRGEVDIRAVAESLPFKDGTFKSIVLESVLKHVFDPKKVLSEAKRVSKKTSYLFLLSPVNVLDEHRHSFTSAEIISLLKNAGYRIKKMRGIGFSSKKIDRLLKRISLGLYFKLRVPVRFCRTIFLICLLDLRK